MTYTPRTSNGWRFDSRVGMYTHPPLSDRLRNIAVATVGRCFKVIKERRGLTAILVEHLEDWEMDNIRGMPLEDTLIAMLRHIYDCGSPIDQAELRMTIPTNLGKTRSAAWWDERWMKP